MIVFKTPDEVALMAQASQVVAEVLELLKEKVSPGITTDDLDRMAEEAIRGRGAIPAFKGYRNYPKTLCASVNEQVVHGIPSKRRLKDGDIIGLDLGAVVSGFYGDSAVTVPVGTASSEGKAFDSSDGRVDVQGHRRGRGGQSAIRHVACRTNTCRKSQVFA